MMSTETWCAFSVLLGMLVWGGLFIRDERLRILIPLRK